jgi:cell division protein FtsB
MTRLGQGRLFRQALLLAAFLGLIAYVATDAVRGAHGLAANHELTLHVEALKKELALLKAQRQRLEHDAELLGPKATAQPALVDEEARSLLDFADPAEIVIVDGDSPSP